VAAELVTGAAAHIDQWRCACSSSVRRASAGPAGLPTDRTISCRTRKRASRGGGADAVSGALALARAEAETLVAAKRVTGAYVPRAEARMSAQIKEGPPSCGGRKEHLRTLKELVARLKRKPPLLVVTCARGSSAHAAVFASTASNATSALPVADAAPSIVTVYHRTLQLKDQLFLAISQSGRSDDLIEQTNRPGRGALAVGLVNDAPLRSPPSAISCCDRRRAEVSVAATKTFVATLSAILRLTAACRTIWLARALEPCRSVWRALPLWTGAQPSARCAATSMMTIGRGPTLAIAGERR